MRFEKHHLLYFGPITVFIEWLALAAGFYYLQGFNPNNAISMATIAPSPMPLIFGLTLTLVGITYSLFSLPLRAYSPYIPIIAIVAGVAFTLTGWIPFSNDGSLVDAVHNISSFVAVAGYISIIWLLREHPKLSVSRTSRLTYKLLMFGVAASFLSIYVVHQYIAYAQLYILFLIQAWTVFIVWHERRETTA